MRYREPFIIFPRKISLEKAVFYYQTYDSTGNRTNARSTGTTNKSAAKQMCLRLWRENKLIPPVVLPTFQEFTKDFWVWGSCSYIKYKQARGQKITVTWANMQRRALENHILPVFGVKHIDAISARDIENWLLSFKDKGRSNQTANHNLFNLRSILGEAVRKGLLTDSVAEKVDPLPNDLKPRSILSGDEARALLEPSTIEKYWTNLEAYGGNLMSALTGMRMGEIQALRWEDVHADHVVVKVSWDRFIGLKETKTYKDRIIPLCKPLLVFLTRLRKGRTCGFVFSMDAGQTPIHEKQLMRGLYTAMNIFGISEEDRAKRRISFHSWRHFFNTYLRQGGIHDSKVQLITGHSSQEMTEHYTHFQLKDFNEVVVLQDKFFDPQIELLPDNTVEKTIEMMF
jgi:integrase